MLKLSSVMHRTNCAETAANNVRITARKPREKYPTKAANSSPTIVNVRVRKYK